MAAKNAVAKSWSIAPSSDGKRWSAWPAGDKPATSDAALAWAPPTTSESGAALTPTGHIVYASQFADDWAGGISQDTSSASGSYSWNNAAFTSGTTWHFWVRAYASSGAQSLPLYVGSKTF